MARDMRTIGRTFAAEIEVYSECKYTAPAEVIENPMIVRYEGIKKIEIVSGADAREIESLTDASGIDDYHEYLILYFENGETSTFRNSYVDMFRVR